MGLPLLDCFLNENGTALAQGGAIPVRFGTWFWGCGMNPARWAPPTEGLGYELSPELQALERTLSSGGKVRDHVSVFSGFDVKLDGNPNFPHGSGPASNLTGLFAPADGDFGAPSIDVLIAREIGGFTRFRSLQMSATGNRNHTYSRESATIRNASEISPMEVYARIFGPDFADPAAGEFVPNPRWTLRQSVLSAVKEDRDKLMSRVGTHDQQRLDQYFTSVRQLEQMLDVLLSGPPDLPSCRRADDPGPDILEGEVFQNDLESVNQRHRALADLLTFALACDQTRVFNMIFSSGISELTVPGLDTTHHQLTHDESIDAELGYQPQATQFVFASMEAWADFVERLASVPEGDGTMLDNCLVFANSDLSYAKPHDVRGLPTMIAGRAGGRITPGWHVRGNTDPVTRVGLTVQQAMGLPIDAWGENSLQTSLPVSEILV
ncbi:MAG: hypothetical protein DRH23_09235 [Deltaproteobacteria bacterium]|nr:DUF1552 domain-containing protein [Deltaproteobacteria bacterium]RLB48159.1 MAG: hypothetical protein DRH23_09235 [Deltaproteobacteria bacterium]